MDDDDSEKASTRIIAARLVGASHTEEAGLVGEVIRRYPLISYFIITDAGTSRCIGGWRSASAYSRCSSSFSRTPGSGRPIELLCRMFAPAL
jgi:hypothetical protein